MKKRSHKHRLRQLLGLMTVFSGLGFVWLAVEMVNGWITRARLRAYHALLSRTSSTSVPQSRFPLSYYQTRLTPGLTSPEVDRLVEGATSKRVITAPLFCGRFAHVYFFNFGLTKRHELIAIFDENSRLLQLDSRNMTTDIA